MKNNNDFGWLPDFPDIRDLNIETDEISETLKTIGLEDDMT